MGARTEVAGAAAIALVLAACGGGDGQDTERSTTTTVAVPPSAPAPPTTVAPASRLDIEAASWQLPAPTSRLVLLADGGELVVLGGQDAAHASVADVFRIDPTTGTASPASPLDPAVHDAAGAQLGDQSLVIAGGTPPARATVQVVTAGEPSHAVGELPAPRTDHVAALVDGTVYVLGGADAAEVTLGSVVASADDGIAWSEAGTLVEAVRYPAVATADGAVYLFGGARDTTPDSTAVQRYDPASGTTQIVAQLPEPLSHASAVAVGGQIWVLGGFVDDAPAAQILRFDPASNTLTPAGSLPGAVTDAAVVATGPATGYLVGGEGPGRATTAAVLVLSAR